MPELVIERRFDLDRKAHRITPNIKIKSEKMHMSIDIKNGDWTKSGVEAAGWMSKHVLWNKPTLQASVADINKRFENINVKMKET